MKKNFIMFGVLAAFAMTATIAKADPGPYDAYLSADPCDTNGADAIVTPCTDPASINVIDAVNYLLTNASVVSPFTSNTDLDPIQVLGPNDYFANVGGIATLAFVSISAGGFNTPGFYAQGFPGAPTFIAGGAGTGNTFFGDGSFANPFPGALNPFVTPFGLVVDHNGSSKIYSDPTLNVFDGGYDHVLAFNLSAYLDGKIIWIDTNNDGIGDLEVTMSNTYILALEDLPLGNNIATNHDYNDAIYLLTHVTPVPEPMTMALFGTGLLGMAARRKKA